MSSRHIAVAIPAMDELATLPATLADLAAQTLPSFRLYVCVNQLDSWWHDGDAAHLAVCRRNADLLQLLSQWRQRLDLTVVDCSSPSLGWPPRRQGVGWARKRLFDAIVRELPADALVVSLDADTRVDADYLRRLALTFDRHPDWAALSVPYYHRLSGDEGIDRPLLRYECYMRHYLLQLLALRRALTPRVPFPYAFTAIGSAMAFTCRAYLRCGGITPLQGGEDFYLMQKFAKTGHVGLFLEGGDADYIPLFPSGRISRRVPFGTGPAVAMTVADQAARYPFFAPSAFDAVADTYACFPALYERDIDTPMTPFLQRQLATDDLWGPLRCNHTSCDRFVRACVERVDGLRILQYLRVRPDGVLPDSAVADFQNASVAELDTFRNALLQKERTQRNNKNQ